MRYSECEKAKMDRLLAVFADYVANSTDIDIAYSEKTGYVRLIIAECADAVFFQIEDYDDMLKMFVDDIFLDYEYSSDDPNPQSRANLFQCAYQHLHDRLNTLEADREYALTKLDQLYAELKLKYIIKDL